MHINSQEDKKIWEGWLGEEDSNLSQYLIEVRKSVKRLYKDDESYGPLPFYTPHGIKHCDAVENLLHRLIPGNSYKELDEKERFYLLASSWLHDIGMLRSVAQEIHGKEITENEIRDKHHETTAEFIVNRPDRCGLNEIDKEVIADICFYHRRRENISKCSESSSAGASKGYRIRLMAAYLRLADALDIGSDRASTPAYSLCLAYNIPSEYKLHWIKNRVVTGIRIDADNKKITIEFRKPNLSSMDGTEDLKIVEDKFNYIIKLVMDDIRDEILSVMNVLIRYKVTYFLDLESNVCEGIVAEQMLTDLRETMINYDIMVHPSSSRLFEMILVTISNIAGFHIEPNKDPRQLRKAGGQDHSWEDIKKRLDTFYDRVQNELLNTRPCHLGLKRLLANCIKATNRLNKNNYHNFKNEINDLYQRHQSSRRKIREKAKDCFSYIYGNIMHDQEKYFNILLFGYSELVIKAICGLRDYIIELNYPGTNTKYFYNTPIETNFSKKINLFICECQPKTHTEIRDRLLYYDGAGYALALRRRQFKNITLIPDIVVANIFENHSIDMVLVGANGFDSNYFIHSAGHSSVIRLARDYCRYQERSRPKIILVVTGEKYSSEKYPRHTCLSNESNFSSHANIYKVDGCNFWEEPGMVVSRKNVWITRDYNVINELTEKEIRFYNPREDTIPIDFVDYIISDKNFYKVRSEIQQEEEIKKNIELFLHEIEKI